MSTSTDSNLCLQSSPEWGVSYNCKNSKEWCNTWARDMRRCCPKTCKNDKLFTKSVCNSIYSNGSCHYPFDTLDGDCGKVQDVENNNFTMGTSL